MSIYDSIKSNTNEKDDSIYKYNLNTTRGI